MEDGALLPGATAVPGVRELLRLSSSGAQREVVVSEHPAAEFNGTYVRVGTWNSRPAYRLSPAPGTPDTGIEYFLYYWQALGGGESSEEEHVGNTPEPELEDDDDGDGDTLPADFGAGWTFDARPRTATTAALTRTRSLVQPPSLRQGCGGITEQPFVSKTYPPTGVVSLLNGFGAVRIERADAVANVAAESERLERIESDDGSPPPAPSPSPPAQELVSEEGVPPALATREQWLSRVMSVQSSRMTPEVRERVKRRAVAQQRAKKSQARAQRLQVCSAMTTRSWAKGMRSMQVATAPEARSASCLATQTEMQSLQRCISAGSSDEECDALMEQIETGVGAFAELQAADDVEGTELDTLLEQLKTEPADDNDRTAKFSLYEKFIETVETMRRQTFDFFKGCRADFEDTGAKSAIGVIERNLAAIDGEANMAVDFREDRWFVYDMTRKAATNNSVIGRTLQDIKTKLELVAQQDDCPICLQALNLTECKVLGCCHKTCLDCWQQWSEIKGGSAFCPLCKNEEFLTDVCEGRALPVELFERVRSHSGEGGGS